MNEKAFWEGYLEKFADPIPIPEERKLLPRRESTKVILQHPNRPGEYLGQEYGDFVDFPGGGVDPGETPETALRREVEEEIGAKLKNIRYLGNVEFDWPMEWAGGILSKKKDKRWDRFKGEKVHQFLGDVDSLGAATSQEGDEWGGLPSHPLDSLLNRYGKYVQEEPHEQIKKYREAVLAALQQLPPSESIRKQAFFEGLNDVLDKHAQFIEQGGLGQTFPGMQQQGAQAKIPGIEEMKRKQKQMMKQLKVQ